MTMEKKLSLLKQLLGTDATVSDEILTYYLMCGAEIICNLRDTVEVEAKYELVQIRIAVELFNKRGVEGQNGHDENGISRSYEASDVSPSLLAQITPKVKTIFGGTV